MEKTAKGLVKYAIAQLGRPYWYGTFGQGAGKALYEQKRRQYPHNYQAEYDASQEGEKVHDCVGLIKGYLWSNSADDTSPVYNVEQDVSANGMLGLCTDVGGINTLPEMPGVLVFFNNHVGVYIGNGEVVEARSRKWGVVKTKLADRPWEKWGCCPYIDYEPVLSDTIMLELPVLKKGTKSSAVRAMQLLLLGNGADLGKYGADGSYGGKTDKAVRAYQAANELEEDIGCASKTWAKLLGV